MTRKYVVKHIENREACSKVSWSWDVYLKDKECHSFVAEFVHRGDAILFAKAKNKKEGFK